MPPLRAVVCTNRPPAAVAACLDALAEQNAPVVLVVSGGGEGTAAAHAGAAAEVGAEATVLREPRLGLSHARNRALAGAQDGDVLAFVDDDAMVGEGWLAAMRRAWARAPAATACIGGPIRPRFVERRPNWLSDALLPVVTTLDLGPEPLTLDPEVTTVFGANVAFRAGPLRDVGGFDPALGHHGGRTWFGEEDAAERALHRAGFAVRYDPGPWVWHVIDPARLRPAAFLARRARYGAGLGARGARGPQVAARQAATSAAGAPLALLRGDERLAMERATRAAENAGALVGRLTARSA